MYSKFVAVVTVIPDIGEAIPAVLTLGAVDVLARTVVEGKGVGGVVGTVGGGGGFGTPVDVDGFGSVAVSVRLPIGVPGGVTATRSP